MKKLILIILISFCVLNCEKQKNPINSNTDQNDNQNDDENKDENTELVWNSTGFPISSRGSSYVFNISVNSSGDAFASNNRGKLYRLISGDTSWVFSKAVGGNYISFIYIDSEDKVYIGANSLEGSYGSTVYSSADNGENWTTLFTNQNDCNNMIEVNDTLYIVITEGVVRSVDQGQNWMLFDNNIENANVMDIVKNPKTSGLFIGTWNAGLFKSTDQGTTWDHIALDDWPVFPLMAGREGDIYACTGVGLFRSKDDGHTWTKLTNGIPEVDILCLTSTSSQLILAGTRELGLFLSNDSGDSWQNIGLENTEILSLGADADDYIYVGTDSLGVLKSNIPLMLVEGI